MNPDSALLGFADPVHDAQRTFRAALEAMARPGTIESIVAPRERPGDFAPAAVALALALADSETAIWLADTGAATADYLRFHCGCPIVDDPQAAMFALGDAGTPLTDFCVGDEIAPERATTVILSVEGFDKGARWQLSGPGIETRQALACSGLDPHFISFWQTNQRRFPAGIDVFLAAGESLVGLPRTVTIKEA